MTGITLTLTVQERNTHYISSEYKNAIMDTNTTNTTRSFHFGSNAKF